MLTHYRRLAAAALIAVVPLPAAAAIEELVVTARQRSESLQDTPTTITALSSDTLDRLNLTDLEQVSQYVPNLRISYGSSGASSSVFLRGIGTGSGSAGFSSAVGLVIDGVFYERGRWIQQGFFDLEQIEVLKGPQSLFYGKNAPAGLIILQTRDPGEEFEAHIKTGYETEAEERMIEAGVTIPVTEDFRLRLAGRYLDMDGWLDNLSRPIEPGTPGSDPFGFRIPGAAGNDPMPQRRDVLGRLTAVWEPTDRFKAEFKASVAENEDTGVVSTTQLTSCFGPGGRPQAVFGVESPFDDCREDFSGSKSNIPAELMAGEPDRYGNGDTFTEYDSYNMSLQFDYELDAVTLTSVTGFQQYEVESVENFTFSDDGQVPGWEETNYDAFSQEFRVQTTFGGPVNFFGGVLYQSTDLYFNNASRIAPLPPDSSTGRLWTWDKEAYEYGRSISVYGELTWDVTETIEISGGARYTDEERDFAFRTPFLHEILAGLGALAPASLDGVFEDDDVSPQLTVTWRPSDSLTFFAAYREGFKSGGFDASFLLTPGVVADDIRFESETADGFEFGIKSSWLDDRLRANATAYFFTYDNLQVQQFDAETTTFQIGNAGQATTDGLELDVTWAPVSGLTLRGALNYNLAEYQEFVASCYAGQTQELGCNLAAPDATPGSAAVAQDLSGENLPAAPEWTALYGLTWETSLGNSGWRGAFSLDGRYQGDYYLSTAKIPELDIDAYSAFDASVRLFSPNDRWELSFIGRNLTDETMPVQGADRPLTGGGAGLPAGSPGIQRGDVYTRVQRGRQLWGTLTYRFSR